MVNFLLGVNMSYHQILFSLVVALSLLLLIIRLVQHGRLNISYCWLWLTIGIVAIGVVLKYDWLLALSHVIGANVPTTTLFLISFIVVFLMCLQFSLVISLQRQQIKRLVQQNALFELKLTTLQECISADQVQEKHIS